MKKWRLTFIIRSYFSFEKPFVLEGISFLDDQKNNKTTYAKLIVDATTIEDAQAVAIGKLNKTLIAIQLALGKPIEKTLKDVNEITSGGEIKEGRSGISLQLAVTSPFPVEMSNDLSSLYFTIINNNNEIMNKALAMYVRGIQIKDWENEAFLKFFAVLEIIAGQYSDEAIELKKRKMQNEVNSWQDELSALLQLGDRNTEDIFYLIEEIHNSGSAQTKWKIEVAANNLGVNIPQKLGALVRARNGIAHGSSRVNVKKAVLDECQEFARQMIMHGLGHSL